MKGSSILDDLLPYKRRLDARQRIRWLHTWKQMTRTNPRYRMIFWTTCAVVFSLELPLALFIGQHERDALVGSCAAVGLSIFFAFCMAAMVPYLFTRSELKRLIERQLAHDRAA